MVHLNRFAALGGMMAALSMAVTPVSASELPTAAPAASSSLPSFDIFDDNVLTAERHRYWRYRGHRHRNRIDAGDVLAGVLIVGGIAAIASAASDSKRRDRDERYRDYRDDRRDYRDRRDIRRSSSSGRGIDGAVDMCLSEVERDVRVDEVESVDRTSDGWRVTGTIFNGDRFTCRIGEDGRIESVDFGGGFASVAPVRDNQHSDARYRAAWAEVEREGGVSAPDTAEQLPAYPGGPIDGDLVDDEPGDDRYRMAEAPAN